jgi:epoxyqueuosine reductase
VAPYEVDARLCISYLTIELYGPIPPALRPLVGNRVYGCDDCQLVCPWNRFARLTGEGDFAPRNDLDAPELTALLGWEEAEFLRRTEGSPIRRIGHERWLRNVAVALGNGPATPAAIDALRAREAHPGALVREHVRWALERLTRPSRAQAPDDGPRQ